MAYATETKLEALMAKFSVDGGSSPDSSQVAVIIQDVEGEIDTALRTQGISTPVTTPAYFLDWLEGLATAGAAARALKSMFPDATGAGETPAYAFWQTIYNNGLRDIKNGTMIPPEVTRSGSGISPSTYFTRNPDEEEDLGDISEPMFRIGKTF